MSYNYDYNPWDENYNNNQQQNQSQNQAQAGGYNLGQPESYATASGYSNPTAAHQDSWGHYNDGVVTSYNETDQQQPVAGQETIDGQQQDGYGGGKPGQQATDSGFKRFLRAHVPLCGMCMDVTSPILDMLLKYVNRDLLVSKVFYFFFYSAFGSLFPLMGVYFKQLGMNPAQVGIINGVRPFIEIFSAPFWNSLAEKFKKGKVLLLFSLLSWIVFTYSLAHIRPPASACVAFNDTDYVLYTPYSANDLSNYDVGQPEESEQQSAATGGGLAKKENEVFMSEMPQANREVSEGKDEILVSEENVNDQGKRRRRRRRSGRKKRSYEPLEQLKRPSLERSDGQHRYKYAFEADGRSKATDEGVEVEGMDLVDIDLVNDFDDTPVRPNDRDSSSVSSDTSNDLHDSPAETSFFENPDPVDSSPEYNNGDGPNELQQQMSYASNGLHRSKRHVAINGHRNNKFYTSDELSEESDTEETEQQRSGLKRNGANGDWKRSRVLMDREDGRRRHDGEGGDEGTDENMPNEQEAGSQAAEGSSDEDSESGDTENGTSNENEINGNKKSSTKHHQHGEQASGSSDTTMTDAMSNEFSHTPDNANQLGGQVNKTKRIYKHRHKTPPTHIVGMSPITVEYAVNYNKEKHGQFVTPMFSTIVYKLDDIKEVFFLLLLLVALGSFFSAPALTIADSITLGCLGENTDLYGRQRMFGSLGWAITLLLVGMALDNSTTIADHPCGPHQRERSYTVCFTIFSLLMGCAFLTATQFTLNYPSKSASTTSGGQAIVTKTSDNNTVVTTTIDGSNSATNVDDLYASTRPREIFNTAPPVNAPPSGQRSGDKFEFLDKWKSAGFAHSTWELPEWFNVFRQFKKSMHLTYLFITWFLGVGVGLVFTFLFWHLQDVGGTPTLFGICSVINHISEVLAYFFSSYFIKRFGHTKVLSVGLGCNVIRFLYVAFLSNPYYALPFELVQGITHAACFAACCSYMNHVSKPELKASTQGVMQGLHNGIGRACGALLGGYMINLIGSRASFCIYGLLSGCVLGGLIYIRKKASLEEDEVKVDDNENLGDFGAPQGVPSAIPGKMVQNGQPQDIDYEW